MDQSELDKEFKKLELLDKQAIPLSSSLDVDNGDEYIPSNQEFTSEKLDLSSEKALEEDDLTEEEESKTSKLTQYNHRPKETDIGMIPRVIFILLLSAFALWCFVHFLPIEFGKPEDNWENFETTCCSVSYNATRCDIREECYNYLKDKRCPKCKSDHLDMWGIDKIDKIKAVVYNCLDCKHKWEKSYPKQIKRLGK